MDWGSGSGAGVRGLSAPPVFVPPKAAAAAQRFVGRRWALEQVADWLEGDERLLLLTGAPGSGKSTFAAWLAGVGPSPDDGAAAHLLESVRAAWSAAHFCMLRGQGGSVDPRRFTESLAKQLAEHHDEFALAAIRSVAPEYNIHLEVRENWGQVLGIRTENLIVTGASPADAFAVAVREPLRALLEVQPHVRVHVLVDGLDEALTPTVPNIVTLLAGSDDLPDGVRFLLTTRNEHRVVDLLAERIDRIRYLDLSAESVAERNEADIRAYVGRRLRELPIQGQNDVGPLADELPRHADGNFLYVQVLLDEVAAGTRRLGDLTGLPRGLHSLYRAYLNRLMPEMEQYGGSQAWLTRYQPLLGSLSVAMPAAPTALLSKWLQWDESEVLARIDDLQQVLERDPRDEGGYRLFHQSLADFLSTERYRDNGSERVNHYNVSRRQQHDRVIGYYLTSIRTAWAGDWTRCDGYGLRQLVAHMEARLRLAENPEEGRGLAAKLYALVMDPGFRKAQRRLGGVAATADGFRAALDVALAAADLEQAERLLAILVDAPEVELRGLAVEGVVQLHAADPARAIGLIKRLLSLPSRDVWGVGLKAAYVIGAEAMEVFRWAVVKGSPELRQAVSYALYLWWRRQPGGFTPQVLNDLSVMVSLRSPRRTRRALELMTDLSITIYINHCERPEVVAQGDELWYEVFEHRLHLGALNRAALVRVLSPMAANSYSRRVLETLLLAELQDPRCFFGAPAEQKDRFRRVVPLMDPAADPLPLEQDLRALLCADVLLFRFTAAITLAIHAYRDFPAMRPMLIRLFDEVDGDARLWELLAFAVLLPDTPPAWTALLERFTARFVDENRATFERGGAHAERRFDFALLPLGLAYGKRGGSMPWFETLLQEGIHRGDQLLIGRTVEGLGPVGFYYPHAVFHTLQPFLADLGRAGVEDALVAALATIRVLHFDAVDVYLRQEGIERLQPKISARSEVELMRRYLAWVGFVNNSVHLAVHYPKMRRRLLIEALETLADCRDAREFLRRHTPVQLSMLHEAEYRLARWTLPD
jgi:hypothetical protein